MPSPVLLEPQVRPIAMIMVGLGQLILDDPGGIGIPIAATAVPQLADLLQTDDVRIEVVDRFGDLSELGG